jgi:hypothetical protein
MFDIYKTTLAPYASRSIEEAKTLTVGSLKDCIEGRGTTLVLLDIQNTVLGWSRFRLNPTEAIIEDLWIHTNYQKQGNGTILLKQMESQIKLTGMRFRMFYT